jgi:hypothetical protein
VDDTPAEVAGSATEERPGGAVDCLIRPERPNAQVVTALTAYRFSANFWRMASSGRAARRHALRVRAYRVAHRVMARDTYWKSLEILTDLTTRKW